MFSEIAAIVLLSSSAVEADGVLPPPPVPNEYRPTYKPGVANPGFGNSLISFMPSRLLEVERSPKKDLIVWVFENPRVEAKSWAHPAGLGKSVVVFGVVRTKLSSFVQSPETDYQYDGYLGDCLNQTRVFQLSSAIWKAEGQGTESAIRRYTSEAPALTAFRYVCENALWER